MEIDIKKKDENFLLFTIEGVNDAFINCHKKDIHGGSPNNGN